MASYKHILSQHFEKMKSTASQLLARNAEEEDRNIELEPDTYDRLVQLAADRYSTVQQIVHRIVEQHFSHGTGDFLRRIPDELKERNPLLLLDGICRQDHREQHQEAIKGGERDDKRYFG